MLLNLLVRYPLLALVPAVGFLVLARRTRRRFDLLTGGAWALYAVYELGVSMRLLCSGECNIRADLLVLYPVLLILSAISIFRRITQ